MCTLYYRQLQVDNQELLEKLDLLEAAEGPSHALQREVVRLREDKQELQLRVRQLEAENRASVLETTRRPKAETELPAVHSSELRQGYESSFQKSPQKRRQHSSRREEARSAAGTSKREAIEALSQMLLNRAAYPKR